MTEEQIIHENKLYEERKAAYLTHPKLKAIRKQLRKYAHKRHLLGDEDFPISTVIDFDEISLEDLAARMAARDVKSARAKTNEVMEVIIGVLTDKKVEQNP